VRFLNAVLDLKEARKNDEDPEAIFKRHITLRNGVKWFTFSNSTLFVRDFYDELFVKGFERFANVAADADDAERALKPSRFFVIGT
jgi:hypothetical protein